MIVESEVSRQIQELFPDFPWDKLKEANRALNAELWQGPLEKGYWKDIDPLDHYEWNGWQQACRDIEDMLSMLPNELYWDADFDSLLIDDPYENPDNWEEVSGQDEMDYMGPQDYYVIPVAEYILSKEVYKQIYR